MIPHSASPTVKALKYNLTDNCTRRSYYLSSMPMIIILIEKNPLKLIIVRKHIDAYRTHYTLFSSGLFSNCIVRFVMYVVSVSETALEHSRQFS